jgi:hypothetical protein
MITAQLAKEKSLRSVEWLAKGSYVAKAIFYATIAVFTVTLAVGSQGPDPSRKQVLEHFASNTFGKFLIALMALALAGHTIWRLVEIWNDPYKKGNGPMGWLYRLNYLLSAVTYAGLGWTALLLLTGQGGGEDNQKRLWVTQLLQLPGGDWAIILVSCLFLAWAGLQIYKGLSGCVCHGLDLGEAGTFKRGFLRVCSLVGFVTLGTTLAGTGWYLMKGAWTKNPDWVRNMDDLVKALQRFPGGWGLQVAAALGFFLMAIFMLAMARYFPVKTLQ